MASWRDIKARARADVHRTFGVPAVYLTHAAGTPVRCNVRIQSKVAVNQNEFTWPATNGYLELDPVAIFDKNEVPTVLVKSFLILGPLEIYRTGTAEPYREQYARVECTILAPAECTAFLATVDKTHSAFLGIVDG